MIRETLRKTVLLLLVTLLFVSITPLKAHTQITTEYSSKDVDNDNAILEEGVNYKGGTGVEFKLNHPEDIHSVSEVVLSNKLIR